MSDRRCPSCEPSQTVLVSSRSPPYPPQPATCHQRSGTPLSVVRTVTDSVGVVSKSTV